MSISITERCSGCGDWVLKYSGCCTRCRGDAAPRQAVQPPREPEITYTMRNRIREMYWNEDVKPVVIWKRTGVRPEKVREICYDKRQLRIDAQNQFIQDAMGGKA